MIKPNPRRSINTVSTIVGIEAEEEAFFIDSSQTKDAINWKTVGISIFFLLDIYTTTNNSKTFNLHSRTTNVLLVEDNVSWVSSLAARLHVFLIRREEVIWRFFLKYLQTNDNEQYELMLSMNTLKLFSRERQIYLLSNSFRNASYEDMTNSGSSRGG